jgi:hypothetical protein
MLEAPPQPEEESFWKCKICGERSLSFKNELILKSHVVNDHSGKELAENHVISAFEILRDNYPYKAFEYLKTMQRIYPEEHHKMINKLWEI